MKQKVTVFGSANADLMSRAEHLPSPGETVRGSLFRQGPGGKGLNQGIAACKAGADIAMVTKLGRDSFASVLLSAIREAGLSEDYLLYSEDRPTGIALILVDGSSGQNEIVVVPGACEVFTEEEIASAGEVIAKSAYLLLQLEINQSANEKAAALAKEKGVKVIVNPAPCRPLGEEFLKGLYLITPNEGEAEALTGITVTDLESADRAATVLKEKGVENVLITLGSRGVYLCADGKSAILPAYRVKAVDTTGAGDAFNGGLLTALSEGKSLWEAAKFANALAALSVTKTGAAASMPTREEIDAFLKERE